MELCYSAKAYYACLIIAFSSIEACINNQFGDDGGIHEKLETAGYADDVSWLRKLRNRLIHKNDNNRVSYILRPDKEKELEELCKRAFVLVHEIYYNPVKYEEA